MVGDGVWLSYGGDVVYALPLEPGPFPWGYSEGWKAEQEVQEYDDGCDRQDKCTR